MVYTKIESASATNEFASGEYCLQQQYRRQQQLQQQRRDLFDEHDKELFTGPRRHWEDVDYTFLFSAMDGDLEDLIEAALTSIHDNHTAYQFPDNFSRTRNNGNYIATKGIDDPKSNISNDVDFTQLKFDIKNNKISMIKLKQNIKHVRSIRCKLHEEQSMISSKISKIREGKESWKNGSHTQNINGNQELEKNGSNLRELAQHNISNLSQVVKSTMISSQQKLNDIVKENKEHSSIVKEHGKTIELLHNYRKAKSFPVRLMNAIKDLNGDENIVAWLNDGKSFVIVDPVAFVAQISKYDLCKKDCKYESFVRKLHRWGFVRLANGTGVDVFHHLLFHRDCPQWTINITAGTSQADSKRVVPSIDCDSSPCLAGIEKFMSLIQN